MEESREVLAHQSELLVRLMQGPGTTMVAFVQQFKHLEGLRAAQKVAQEHLEKGKVCVRSCIEAAQRAKGANSVYRLRLLCVRCAGAGTVQSR